MRNLRDNPSKFFHYDKAIKDYLANDCIEEIKNPQICGHYLPHQAVIKYSVTTHLQVVFKARAKVGANLGLKNVLETGSSLTEKLIDSLLLFRTKKYGLIADISKAFVRTGLHELDWDSIHFL